MDGVSMYKTLGHHGGLISCVQIIEFENEYENPIFLPAFS
jgi:hypothetical protein